MATYYFFPSFKMAYQFRIEKNDDFWNDSQIDSLYYFFKASYVLVSEILGHCSWNEEHQHLENTEIA